MSEGQFDRDAVKPKRLPAGGAVAEARETLETAIERYVAHVLPTEQAREDPDGFGAEVD